MVGTHAAFAETTSLLQRPSVTQKNGGMTERDASPTSLQQKPEPASPSLPSSFANVRTQTVYAVISGCPLPSIVFVMGSL